MKGNELNLEEIERFSHTRSVERGKSPGESV
jgi:hypothetical protein